MPVPPSLSDELLHYEVVRNDDIDQWVADHVTMQTGFASEHVDLVIIFVDKNGEPILPDVAKITSDQSSGPQETTNELTFTYNSPDYPFTQEDLDILQPAVNAFKGAISEIFGPPAFNITVNIRKNPNINYAGLYYTYDNEIVVSSISENTLDVICHEMVHAYHDDYIILFNSYEEGFARSVEVLVFSSLSEYQHRWDNNFSDTYDVWYEATNKPGIGGENGSFSYGNTGLTLFRYQMGGYAWAKVFYENGEFYKDFNSTYYSRLHSDEYISRDEEELKSIVRSIVPSIEGQSFDDWYEHQYILDSNPSKGYQLTSRTGQFTFDYFYREEYGYEDAQAGATISADFFNSTNDIIDSQSAVTSPMGWADIYPTVQEEYFGRLKIVASADSPDGVVTETYYRTPFRSDGVFGITTISRSGEVTIFPPQQISVVTAPVEEGAFYVPELRSVEGRFVAIFQPTDGRVVSKHFNKGASDYFVLINEESPLYGCICDLDGDGDMDGKDLATFSSAVLNGGLVSVMAAEYGGIDCMQ